jgi:putative tryptophan/tyrosine transport system substrate-binding protein
LLNVASPEEFAHVVAGFGQGLEEAGFADGRNIKIEFRWANNDYAKLPALAADLVSSRVAVIAVVGPPATLAVKRVTQAVPVVFVSGLDPVEAGFVESLGRPGGNMTGISLFTSLLGVKHLELLRELLGPVTVALLVNPGNPNADSLSREVVDAARASGQRIAVLRARDESAFDAVFTKAGDENAGALLVGGDPLFNARRERLVALAASHRMPAIYALREFVHAGGLVSYGASITDVSRQMGVYVGRVLKGAKPAELPVLQPTKFELVVNMKAAKALGLAIPPTFLARADEVIE